MKYGVHSENGIGLAFSAVLSHDHDSSELPQEVIYIKSELIDCSIAKVPGAN